MTKLIGKKRTKQHIIGESGISYLKKKLPSFWVIREYIPDYGIDADVELFEEYEGDHITTGEHILFQVKATNNLKVIKKSIFGRKQELVSYPLEVEELELVEKMGHAVVVMLAVVDLKTESVYFLCLNDYIDKVLKITDINYTEKRTKSIYIPINNTIDDEHLGVISWYGKRAKLYALFNEVNCWKSDYEYAHGENRDFGDSRLRQLVERDVWDLRNQNPTICTTYDNIITYLTKGITDMELDWLEKQSQSRENIDEIIYKTSLAPGEHSLREIAELMSVKHIWNDLQFLSELFETYWRKWFTPAELV